MRRGTIIFLLFLVTVAVIVGISQFLQRQPAVDLEVAVSPLALEWVSAALERYNATNPLVNTSRLRFVAVPVEDMDVWTDGGALVRAWTDASHPVAWLPAWSASLTYANRLPFTRVTDSLANTVLVWGGFQSRMNALAEGGQAFDWARVADAAAQGTWAAIAPTSGVSGNFTLAFNRPTQKIAGLAAVFSSAARFAETATLSGGSLSANDFRAWLQPVLESVPNFNTLGASPAQTIAARGASVGEIALLPESDWLKNLRGQLINIADPIQLIYPAPLFVFDFPLAAWSGASAPSFALTQTEIASAVQGLAAFLSSPAEQSAAQTFGLRPADGRIDPTAPLFAGALPYGADLVFDSAEGIMPPTLNEVQRLLVWLNNVVP